MKLTEHLNTPMKVWAFSGVITVVIPAVVWMNVILPLNSQASEAASLSQNGSQALVSARGALEAATATSAQLPQILEQARIIHTKIPNTTATDSIVDMVTVAAGRAAVLSVSTSDPVPASITGDANQEGSSTLYEVDIAIQIAGPKEDVLNFPNSLANQGRLFAVTGISYSQDEEGASATLTAKAWVAEGDLLTQAQALENGTAVAP